VLIIGWPRGSGAAGGLVATQSQYVSGDSSNQLVAEPVASDLLAKFCQSTRSRANTRPSFRIVARANSQRGAEMYSIG